MKIVFAYKGRYHVRDGTTLELLSAIARSMGHETYLAYDQDLFGVTDNVFSAQLLNRFFSREENIVRRIVETGARAAIFIDGFNRRGWNDDIAKAVKERSSAIAAVFLSGCGHRPKDGIYDFVLEGEPELSFIRFLADKVFERGKGSYTFKGLADLDELPLPDKALFAPYVNFKDSYLVYTSKGCPYTCSYCEESIYKAGYGSAYYRRRSPAGVIRELAEAKRRIGIKDVIYKDSVFALDKDWLKNYLKIYRDEIALPYKCFAKAEAFDDELALMLKESGCRFIEFGVQTFNEGLKKRVLNRDEETATILKAFSICDRYGIRYDADHLFGIPGETAEDHVTAARTYSGLRYLNRIKCHNLAFYREARIYEFAPQYIKDDKAYNADFFSSVAGEKGMLKANRAFEKYFKVLPLLPGGIRRFLSRGRRWKVFCFLPQLFILLGMVSLALKHRDRRYWVYLKYYPRRLRHALLS